MTGPWLAVWRCGCSDIELTPEAIPDECPTHGAVLIVGNDGRGRVELDGEPISGFGVQAEQVIT